MSNYIEKDVTNDGIDRRGLLKCMAWAGTGVVWTVAGGVLSSCNLVPGQRAPRGSFTFVQLSDSHVGFNKAPNADVVKTLQTAIDGVSGLPDTPDLMIHTGDLTHLRSSRATSTPTGRPRTSSSCPR